MTTTTEQPIPWLRGERRSAGGADAVAARDQPERPRGPMREHRSRGKTILVLGLAIGLAGGAVVIFLGPLAASCGPVGEVHRCDDRPPAVPSTDKPWTAAFESVVPASESTVVTVTGPALLVPAVIAPVPAVATKPRAARRPAPVKAKVSVPVRKTAEESSSDSDEDE